MNPNHPNFVPADAAGERSDTAALLVGTAREFGIHQRSIKRVSGGYVITDELADILEAEYADEEETEGTESKVSGNESSDNRVGKKKQKKGK